MKHINALITSLPGYAVDVRLNVELTLAQGALTPNQRWGVALTAAASSNEPLLTEAIRLDAHEAVGAETVDDAMAAATMMAMTNIYYRFRHLVGKPEYTAIPPRLRMNRLNKPASSKMDQELFALVASAINGCESCVRAHEQVVTNAGLSKEQVNDAIRLASTMHAIAVTLQHQQRRESATGVQAQHAAAHNVV